MEIVSTSQIRLDNRPADDPQPSRVSNAFCVRSSLDGRLFLKAFASCPRHVPARREAPASLSLFLDSVHFMAGHAIAREGGHPLQEIAASTGLDGVGHLIEARV